MLELMNTQDDAILSIACPKCEAYPGDRCHSMASSGWRVVRAHRERVLAAHRKAP